MLEWVLFVARMIATKELCDLSKGYIFPFILYLFLIFIPINFLHQQQPLLSILFKMFVRNMFFQTFYTMIFVVFHTPLVFPTSKQPRFIIRYNILAHDTPQDLRITRIDYNTIINKQEKTPIT
jgi:hypothetical protein